MLGIPRLVNGKNCCIITLRIPPFLLQVDQSEKTCCCLQPIRIRANKLAYGPERLEPILWLTVLMLYCTNFGGVKQSVFSPVFFRKSRSIRGKLSCKYGPVPLYQFDRLSCKLSHYIFSSIVGTRIPAVVKCWISSAARAVGLVAQTETTRRASFVLQCNMQ